MACHLNRMAIDAFEQDFPDSKLFEQLAVYVATAQPGAVQSDADLDETLCTLALQILISLKRASLLDEEEQAAALEECATLQQAEHIGRRELFKDFPLFCGAFVEGFIEGVHLDGIQACRFESRVTVAAHLYHASSMIFPGMERWPDMDHAIAAQGQAGIGINPSESGKDTFATLKGYCLAMGVPKKTALAMKLKQPFSLRSTIPDKADPSQLALPTVTAKFLQIESAEVKTHQSLGFAPENVRRSVLEHLAQSLLDDGVAGNYINQAVLKKCKQRRELSQIELLEVFVAHLQREELNLVFDYHAFATRCSTLIDHVIDHYVARIEYHKELFGDASKLTVCGIAKGILLESALFDPRQKGADISSLMLSDLAAYLSTYGEQHGDTGIRSSEDSLARLRVAEDR